MLRVLAGPFAHTGVKFVPLGGVGPDNLVEYLALLDISAVGGSWKLERSLTRGSEETERLALDALVWARS